MSFSITPPEVLRMSHWFYKPAGEWLVMPLCPFCGGGNSKDPKTFSVHKTDGSFGCLRSSCGVHGNFWTLLESVGLNPRDYWSSEGAKTVFRKKTKSTKRFIYGVN